MTRAPSSGVNCSFSTAVRTCFISVSATFHFGSIAGPNSAGFIDANCRTSDGLTVSVITQPPLGRRTDYKSSWSLAVEIPAPVPSANSEVRADVLFAEFAKILEQARLTPTRSGRRRGNARSLAHNHPAASPRRRHFHQQIPLFAATPAAGVAAPARQVLARERVHVGLRRPVGAF